MAMIDSTALAHGDVGLESADLFCGLGGASAGLLAAAAAKGRRVNLLAINHAPEAIDTHRLNHERVNHLCENLDNVEPRRVVPGGRLHIMLASPECTHFSNARGGKPRSDQSRASAWHVTRWAEALRIDHIIVENVREFRDWGPLDRKGKVIQHRKGEIFRAWMNCLKAIGYHVDDKLLNAADFGAATSRERLFIQASRRCKPRWPERTHYDPALGTGDLVAGECWRGAREIIDWSYPSQSIFNRKRPLVPKTLKRIEAGLRKFGGIEFVIGQQSKSAPRAVSSPLPTIATRGAISLVEPFLVVLRNNGDARSLKKPLPTLCAGGGHVGLCEPFIIPLTHGGGESRCHDLKRPLPTVTTAKRGEMALIEPFLVKYYGTGSAVSCHAPMPTITTNDRFGLCQPEPLAVFERDGVTYALMDIKLRMLQPHELAAGMGLAGYLFPEEVTKEEKNKMIGNAVEMNMSRALCMSALM